MSVYAFEVGSFTPGVGAADNVTETGTIMAMLGGSSTQINFVEEVYLGGLAASTAPMIMMLARNSTIGATPTALAANSGNSAGPLHPSATATTTITYIAASTLSYAVWIDCIGAQNIAFNAYGGMVRCNYANTQDRFAIFGNTASLGEFSLSSFTGSTASSAMSGHLLTEQL